jgi:hypothetical protein
MTLLFGFARGLKMSNTHIQDALKMSGRDEAKVRLKLMETGEMKIMFVIRSIFFTHTVPCELYACSTVPILQNIKKKCKG